MNNNQYVIDDCLKIESEIPILSLLELDIHYEINKHNGIKLRVLIDEKNHSEVLYHNWFRSNLAIWDYRKEDTILFTGSITKVTINKENKYLSMDVSGLGSTSSLDIQKKKRSFQNPDLTYRQIAIEILKNHEGFQLNWQVTEDKKIERPILQYEETDWQFLLRICSHFNKNITIDTNARKRMFFGMRQGKEQKYFDEQIFEIGYQHVNYLKENTERIGERNLAFYLNIEHDRNWEIGDYVIFHKRKYTVYEKNVMFVRGSLIFKYFLGTEGLCYQHRIMNKALKGVRLEGRIEKVEKESVYLQLNIDDNSKCADYPWPWVPETNNMSYCMPEINTMATLYMATTEEKDGVAILSTPNDLNKYNNREVEKREFETIYRQKIRMYPELLSIEMPDKSSTISLNDNEGINISSNYPIAIQTKANVFFDGVQLSVNATLKIAERTSQSNIEICRDFNVYAVNGVKIVGEDIGSTRDSYIKNNKNNNINTQKPVEHWRLSFSALASVPAVDFSNVKDSDQIIDLYAIGGIPKVGNGSTAVALSEVMNEKAECESSFPKAFQSMENYTVKGGYLMPDKK